MSYKTKYIPLLAITFVSSLGLLAYLYSISVKIETIQKEHQLEHTVTEKQLPPSIHIGITRSHLSTFIQTCSDIREK